MIRKTYHPLLELYFSDVVGVALAWWVAYLIRFNFAIPPEFLPGFFLGLDTPVLQGLLLLTFGLYRSLWVFASLPDLVCIGRAVAVATVLTPLAVDCVLASEVPRLVFLLQPLALLAYMGGTRALYRTWKESRLYGGLRALGQPVRLGAGEAAAGLLRTLSCLAEWRLSACSTTSRPSRGARAGGCMRGRIADLERVAEEFKVGHAIIAMPTTP